MTISRRHGQDPNHPNFFGIISPADESAALFICLWTYVQMPPQLWEQSFHEEFIVCLGVVLANWISLTMEEPFIFEWPTEALPEQQ